VATIEKSIEMIAKNAETIEPEGDIASLPIAVGDAVVYAAHGVGRVVALEQKQVGGSDRDCVVVDLAAGLRVTLPLSEAVDRLRRVAGEVELEDVQKTLASPPSERGRSWTTRIKTSKAKLAGGKATDLAEIVRDGDRFERGAPRVRLSHGEQGVHVHARALLVRELCSARRIEEDEAGAWIDAQITAEKKRGTEWPKKKTRRTFEELKAEADE